MKKDKIPNKKKLSIYLDQKSNNLLNNISSNTEISKNRILCEVIKKYLPNFEGIEWRGG